LQLLKKGTSSAEKVTISFYVRSPKTGTHILEIQDRDNTRSISKSYTINTADTFEYKQITFDGDTSGALNDDNGESFRLTWWLQAGSTYTSGTLATSWEATTSGNRAVGQVNIGDNVANNFFITGIQMEVGSQATPFEHRSFGEELALCQRYFYRIDVGSGSLVVGNGFQMAALTTTMITVYPKVVMRAAPTLAFLNLIVGDFTSYTSAVTSVTSNLATPHVVQTRPAHASGGASFRPAALQGNGNASAYFDLIAEL
jgi:hypothetical protein